MTLRRLRPLVLLMVVSACAAETAASQESSGGDSAADARGEPLGYEATRDDDCTEWDPEGECVAWEDDG